MSVTLLDTLQDGTQRTQITDGTDNVGITTVAGSKAINVAVLSNTPTSGPNSATLSSVASSAASVSLLASNANRKKFILLNDSTKNARVAFAATATTSSFTIKLPPGALYESELSDYTGVISAIWEAANGFMRVTEIS